MSAAPAPFPGDLPDIQKISIKILTDAPVTLALDPILAIFGRWRTDTNHPAQWVDLADYAHMVRGPGIVLIGKRCNFSFDMGGAAPGILYSSKRELAGSPADRLRAAIESGLELAHALIAESEFPAVVKATGGFELAFNDRLETPNTEGTDRLLRPVVTQVFDALFGRGSYELKRQPDPGKLYGFAIRTTPPPDLKELRDHIRS
jgi:hypothetical protein